MGNKAQLGEAYIPIRALLDKLDGDLASANNKVDGSVGKMVASFEKVGKLGLAGVASAASAVLASVASVAKLSIDAAPIQGLSKAFDGLTASTGQYSEDVMRAMQESSNGMIAQRGLLANYNKAANLISVDFANDLPEYLQYLSKVSASTGEDLDYLMDSVVRGIGRMSPIILDNMNVLVSVEEATARAAEMYGVEEDSLTKAQKQAGMAAVVMEKLAANTETMGDVDELTSTKIAALTANIQNVKDYIGTQFDPVLSIVLDLLMKVGDKGFNMLSNAILSALPTILAITQGISKFVNHLLDGESLIDAFRMTIIEMFPEETAIAITAIIIQVTDFTDRVSTALAPIAEFITTNVGLTDVLISLGAAIATVVLPLIWNLIAAVAPVILAFLAVVAVVALVRNAWENDFLRMRTALTDLWENNVQPALQAMVAWLKEKVPEAIASLSAIWEEKLLPAIATLWEWFDAKILPVFESVANFITTVMVVEFKIFAAFITDVLLPALERLWEWFHDKIIPVIADVANWLSEKLSPAFDNIGKEIEKVVGWIDRMTEKLKSIDVSAIFKPGSPTPFEMGLRGINDAMSTMSVQKLPQLTTKLNLLPDAGGISASMSNYSGSTQLDTTSLEAKIDNLGRVIPVAFRDAVSKMV